MISYNLIQNDKLTNTAILFSDQNTNKSSFIACTRWEGLDKDIAKDDVEYYGSVLEHIDNALEFVKKHASFGWIREGGKAAHTNIAEYDLESVRERNY